MSYKKKLTVIWNYKLLSLAFLGLIAGAILYFTHHNTISEWLMGSIAIIESFPIIKSMWQDIRSGSYGIDILALTAIVASVILRQDFAAIIIVIMLTGGESLEDYAEKRAHSELDALLKGAPEKAHVLRGRKVIDIPANDVKIGDKLLIKAGELVPVDATIIEGSSTFDESSLSGESLPVLRTINDQIISGSINNDSPLKHVIFLLAKFRRKLS